MNRLARTSLCLLGALLLPPSARAAPLAGLLRLGAGATLLGSERLLTGSADRLLDQYDPSISGSLVTFTVSGADDRDFVLLDLATGAERRIASPGNQDLGDVAGGLVVYTDEVTADVVLHDPASGASSNLTGPSASVDIDPSIGGGLVAWTSNRDVASGLGAQVYAQELSTGAPRRLSTETPEHRNERSDTSGGVVVWQACLGGVCDVWLHDWASGTSRALTTTPSLDERLPDTDGRRVAYQAQRGGTYDLCLQEVAGGPERCLSLPGDQSRPRVSGDWVSFEDAASGQLAVRLWHLPSDAVFDLPPSAGSRFLSALDGNRLVYTDDRGGQLDVYLYEFTLVLPPVADAGLARDAYVGDPVALAGTAVDPGGLPVTGWSWAVESAPAGATWTLTGADRPSATFTGDLPGDYLLSLVASNAWEASAPARVAIRVAEWLPPVATATAGPLSGPAPLQVCFDGSPSRSPQGGALSYLWTFGDGGSAPGASACHTYAASPQAYAASLTVTDSRGYADQDLLSVLALEANRAPVASPSASPPRGSAPLAVRFSSSASDPDGDALSYRWDFGDPSSADPLSTLADPVHVFASPGTYTVWLAVSDGQASTSRSVLVTVDPRATLDVREVRVAWAKRGTLGIVTLRADFTGPLPAPDDTVAVELDGIQLLAAPFSAFTAEPGTGLYRLSRGGTVARLDFDRGRLFLHTGRVALRGLDARDGAQVALHLGPATAVDTAPLRSLGHDLLHHQRPGCEGDRD